MSSFVLVPTNEVICVHFASFFPECLGMIYHYLCIAVYFTMPDTICFVMFFEQITGSLSLACTLMSGVPLNVNSCLPLLLSYQINSSTELGSLTGMIILAGLLLLPQPELSLVVWCHFGLLLLWMELQGPDKVPVLILRSNYFSSSSGSQTSLFIFFNSWWWWLNWSNC